MTGTTKFNEEKLRLAVNSCKTWNDVLRFLGYRITGGNLTTVKKYVNKFNISFSHFSGNRPSGLSCANSKYTDNEVFVVDTKATIDVVKARFRKLYPPSNCSRCNIGNTWNGKSLTLQIDHINGNRNDNRIENLRYLCPNCHTQTSTFGRANKRVYGAGYRS